VGRTKQSLPTPFSMTLTDFRAALQPRFCYMDDVIDAIYYGITMKKHVILWGPGGHAKSTIVEEALKLFIGETAFYKETYITNGAEDMDVTPVMGYDNIPKWQSEGVLEKVLTDTIFLKNRFAILEEGLDSPGGFLNALKDPLMRGFVCINGTCHPNRLESMFICTNVDPYAWAGKDNARLATLQRFRFSVKVEWPSYDYKAFEHFLVKRGASSAAIVSKFAEICHTNKWPVSPRSTEGMAECYELFGIEALRHFENMPAPVYQKLLDYTVNIPFIQQIESLKARVTALSSIESLQDRIVEANAIASEAAQVKGIPIDGGFSATLKNIITTSKEVVKKAIAEMGKPKIRAVEKPIEITL
jgi:MoxR-like ATPase